MRVRMSASACCGGMAVLYFEAGDGSYGILRTTADGACVYRPVGRPGGGVAARARRPGVPAVRGAI